MGKQPHPFIQVDDVQVWLMVGRSGIWDMLALPCRVGENFLNQLVPNAGSQYVPGQTAEGARP